MKKKKKKNSMLEQRSHAGKLLKLALLAVVNYAPLFAVTYKTNKDKNTYSMQIRT